MVEHNPAKEKSAFSNVPIEVRVCVGKARPAIKDLLRLQPDAVLQLDKTITEPVELYVGDKLLALGELQELSGEQDGQLAIRIIEIAQPGPET